jgi:hypothetical protein
MYALGEVRALGCTRCTRGESVSAQVFGIMSQRACRATEIVEHATFAASWPGLFLATGAMFSSEVAGDVFMNTFREVVALCSAVEDQPLSY